LPEFGTFLSRTTTTARLRVLWRDDFMTLSPPLAAGRLAAMQSHDFCPRALSRLEGRIGRRLVMRCRNKHVAAALALGLAVSALATPSFAQRSEGPRGGEAGMSAKREKALRDCNAKAGKMSQSTWGHQQLAMHRSCMMEHGEPE
jgi:hypothetical protein